MNQRSSFSGLKLGTPTHNGKTMSQRLNFLGLKSGTLTPYWFILPAGIIMVLGLIYPLFNSFYLSFYDWAIGTPWESRELIGVSAYLRMLEDDAVLESIWVTAKFGFWVIVFEMVLGVALALVLEKPIFGASIYRTIFIMPLMVSPVVVGLTWRYLFDTRVGWINHYIQLLGFDKQPWLADSELAMFAIVFTDIWQWTPFIFLIVLAGLQALPQDVIQAARIEGAKGLKLIFLIKLPMNRSVLIIALLMRLIDVFRALEVMFILTYGGPGRSTEVLSLHIYKTAFDGFELGYAAAISVILILIVFLLSLGILVMSNPLKEKSDT